MQKLRILGTYSDKKFNVPTRIGESNTGFDEMPPIVCLKEGGRDNG